MKKRLDIWLVEQNLVRSRNVAKELILKYKIKVNDKTIDKPNYLVDENDKISILENEKYVSRAAYKLLHAIEVFNPDLENKVAIDIGSSTGGFTQVLLENNVSKVYCIDVGTEQLDKSLRENKNIKVYENTNFKDVNINCFDERIDIVTADVSFISIKIILKKILEIFNYDLKMIILLKPQYEIGTKIAKTKGYVRKEDHKKIIDDFIDFCNANKIKVLGQTISPIEGAKKQNTEYLFYLENNNGK